MGVNFKYTRFCGGICFKGKIFIRDHLNKYLLFLHTFINRKQNMQGLNSARIKLHIQCNCNHDLNRIFNESCKLILNLERRIYT